MSFLTPDYIRAMARDMANQSRALAEQQARGLGAQNASMRTVDDCIVVVFQAKGRPPIAVLGVTDDEAFDYASAIGLGPDHVEIDRTRDRSKYPDAHGWHGPFGYEDNDA